PDRREDFASSALRVGVLAIKQASGVVDARAIRNEADRLVQILRDSLGQHTTSLSNDLRTILQRYFDPNDGEFPQRVDRLIRRDGELESLLARHLNGDGSTLAQTLETHFGESSPLLQVLSPDHRRGILAALKETVNAVLMDHGKHITGQFSLDDKGSALSRLVCEITDKNGVLQKSLKDDMEKIRKEFSLDHGDGALARLVASVERANKTILAEFSMDDEKSALSRMRSFLEQTNQNIDASLSLDDDDSSLSRLRRELLNVVGELKRGNDDFQRDVRLHLETFQARRQEAARSTTHGFAFEEAAGEFIGDEARRLNDLFEVTKDSSGSISRKKIGDYVAILGAESRAPGARIVFESKEDKSYTVNRAIEDLRVARENRTAQVGVFVWSKSAAPENLEPLTRHGQDILAVWDANDPSSDVILKAAISLARLMAVQERVASEETAADIAEVESCLTTIARELSVLDEINTMANTVKNNGEKIMTKAGSLKRKIEDRIETLTEHVSVLKSALTSES
ncbi:MAG: hypothetical protein ACLQGP_14415, partial [Isosphaeraceae bacterium]